MATNILRGGSTGGTWNVAANWSGGTVPVTGDNFIIPAGTAYAVPGYNATSALLVNGDVETGFIYGIGSSTTYLQVDCDNLVLDGSNTSSAQYISVTNSTSVTVKSAKQVTTAGSYGLNLRGASNAALNVEKTNGGTVSVAALAGETAGFTTISSYGGTITIGSGVTTTTVNLGSGAMELRCAATTVTVYDGTLTLFGTGAITTLNGNGGTTYYNTSGTITTANLRDGATLDCSQDGRTKTITALKMAKGSTYRDPHGVVTLTNGIDLINCTVDDVTIEYPANKKITFAAVS